MNFFAFLMLLNSSSYIVFLFCGCIAYWLLPSRIRPWLLLGLGIFFYTLSGWQDMAILVALLLWTYATSKLLLRTPKNHTLIFGIGVLILALAFFKYASLLPSAMRDGGWSLVMPLGMSYFIFEFISILADIKRGTITEVRLKDIVAFAFFFPPRSAGPIKRYEKFVEQYWATARQWKYLHYGLLFLLLGYAQKLMIADPVTPFTNALQNPEVLRGPLDTLLHLYAYSVRIYTDFAGLSNIAIGSSLLFGIVVPKNFEYPYLRPNIALFWRKWHMSLSDWARDYIYIPLGGNRVGALRMFVNLLIVMAAIGVWHGSSLNFLFWGIYHGCGLVIHRIWSTTLGTKIKDSFLRRCIGILITFHFVTIGWALFVTNSLSDSLTILATLFGLS